MQDLLSICLLDSVQDLAAVGLINELAEQQAEEVQEGDDLLDALLGSDDDDDAFASLAPAAMAAPSQHSS